MKKPRSLLLMILAPALAFSAGAGAQPERDPPRRWRLRVPGENRDEMAARLLGVLSYTNVTVKFDETPVREVIAQLSDKLGITITGRYSDAPPGHGIDPTTPITLAAENTPALDVLERILGEGELGTVDCTWQIRKGFVEVGTKARLSVPAARQRRTYYIADVIIDIPDIPWGGRQRREALALDVVADIVENIEPDAWDYGQAIEPEDPEEPASAEARDTQQPGAEGGEEDGSAPAGAAPQRRYVKPRKIALIRYWRDVLIVDAPDYIHRQIGGYPEPIRPDGAGTATP